MNLAPRANIKEKKLMSEAKDLVRRNVSALVVSGIISIIFGVAAVFWPHLTLLTLLYLFGAYVLIAGIVRIVMAFASISDGGWWFLNALLGLFELGVGVYLLRHVNVAFATFILLIGFVLIARGIIGIVDALFDRAGGDTSRTLTFIVGALALVVGIVVLFQPVSSGIAFVWIIGVYALIAGAIELSVASELNKSLKKG
jgi:uncharacterized membrane protein HdeD (DUF308 family)